MITANIIPQIEAALGIHTRLKSKWIKCEKTSLRGLVIYIITFIVKVYNINKG